MCGLPENIEVFYQKLSNRKSSRTSRSSTRSTSHWRAPTRSGRFRKLSTRRLQQTTGKSSLILPFADISHSGYSDPFEERPPRCNGQGTTSTGATVELFVCAMRANESKKTILFFGSLNRFLRPNWPESSPERIELNRQAKALKHSKCMPQIHHSLLRSKMVETFEKNELETERARG